MIDPDRMLYIAGYNQPTYSGIRDRDKLRSMDGYEVTRRGDGTVPHQLGLLQAPDGRPVPTFYIEEEHSLLPGNQTVMAAIDDLLQTGTTSHLTPQIPSALRGEEDETTRQAAHAELLARRDTEEAHLRALASPLQTGARARGEAFEEAPLVNECERELADLLTRGFISAARETAASAAESTVPPPQTPVTTAVPRIKIRLCKAAIQDIGQSVANGELPVDAIAVGHYIGVKPVAAEKALDLAIKRWCGNATG